jgi:polysaccharide chain length determinant protein (PEP-CTERM system associated)
MNELLIQVTSILRGMWRFRWPAVIVAWIVGAVGTVVIFKIPNQYEATARIYVDTQSILRPLLSGLAIQPNIEQQVGMLSRTLISRPNIEKLVRMADLDLAASSKAQQEKLIEELMKDIRISSTARDNLFSLSYRESDQERAKRVIQALVSIFVESGLGASRKDSDSAKVFLNEQIKNFEAKLEEAEGRLKEFRLRNLDLQTAEGKDAASRLGDLTRQLEDARLQLREAENARDSAKSQLAAERARLNTAAAAVGSAAADAVLPVATPEIDARLDAQKRNLDQLLQRFTDQHPDVVNARRVIKELEDQKRREVAALRKAAAANVTAGVPVTDSPAMMELSRLLAGSEVQVASLRARVGEFSGRLAAARVAMRTAPQLEAEAAQLNRDYEITKKNYEDLVARRQSAVISGDLDSASGVADFRLIDPPRVSPKPVFPNRLLLLPVALVAALGAGLFTAFAGTQLRPVYSDPIELRAKTGLPLLGIVSVSLGDVERRRERMDKLRFLGASGGLVVTFALGLVAMAILANRAG